MRRTQADKFNGSILIADDHEVVRFGLAQLLRRSLGADRIIEAERFQDVLALLETSDPRLIVCDLAMPGLDRPAMLASVRRRRPEAKLVVLSGIGDREAVLEALGAGVHGYIVKSTTNDGLVERLRYVLSGEIYVPPLLAEPVEPRLADPAEPLAANGAQTNAIAGLRLSPRQMQVLCGLVRGLTNKEIARELELAEGTIKMHVGAVLRALGASNRAHAAALGQHLVT